ncbi:MAG: phytanoyl-CoA dioxygenase, partial [Bacteroidota bacterium]
MDNNNAGTATMVPDNQHRDIPGNPSTAKSSSVRLRTEASPDTLRVLSIEDWKFWQQNGYVVIKNAVSREQATE